MFNPKDTTLGENTGKIPDNAQGVYGFKEYQIASELYTPDHYLIDLNLFKDLRVGAFTHLLNQLPFEEGKKYYDLFYKNLLQYQNRPFEELVRYVPGCPFSEEEIDKVFEDESLHEDILFKSPVTSAFRTLSSSILININNSRVAERWTVNKLKKGYEILIDPIYFHINTYPLKLSSPILEKLKVFFQERYTVHIEFIYTPPKEYTVEQYMLYDEMFLRSAWDVFETDWLVEKPIFLDGIHNRYMTAAPIFPREWKSFFKEGKALELHKSLRIMLNTIRDVSWIPHSGYAIDETLYPEMENNECHKTPTNQTQNQSRQEQTES